MMYSQNKAAQYRAVRNHGLVAEATPARLVQIMYEQVLQHLATAQGCMSRIRDNQPLPEVVAKCDAIGKAVRIIGHLDSTLNMEVGGEVAANLRRLYAYIQNRMTLANATNDAVKLAEVARLVTTVKKGWDQLVAEGR
jgi:flagellar protein FliS